MSRNNDNSLQNPATRFIEWSGSDGTLSYYDKVKKEKVPMKLPFTFILLDELTTISGYSNADKQGVYSNEIKDLATQKLNVRCGNQTIELGLYADIKDAVIRRGGKYAKSCYIAFKDETGELVIGNIKMVASSFGGGAYKEGKTEIKVPAWIDFSKDNKSRIYKDAIVMSKNPQECVNGNTKFFCPAFALKEITEETDNKAKELCTIVEEYHKAYFANTGYTNENKTSQEEPTTTKEEPTMNGKIPSNATETLHAPPSTDVWPPQGS